MGLDHVEYLYTAGLSERDVEDRLADTETGTLALASDGESYAIPVAIHWDGRRVLLRLGLAPDSDKRSYIAATATATLVCYEYEGATESWSVVVRGPLRELGPPGKTDFDETAINEMFPPLRVFDETVDDIEPTLFALEPAEITGRRTVDG